MKKRWIAVLLCAALLAAFGWGQPRISGEGETYDLYFLEADLSDAPGGDALRAEPLYIESGEVRDTRELAEYLVSCWRDRRTPPSPAPFQRRLPCCPWSWMVPGPRWTSPPATGCSPAWRWPWQTMPSP